jgi:hypothetical protein
LRSAVGFCIFQAVRAPRRDVSRNNKPNWVWGKEFLLLGTFHASYPQGMKATIRMQLTIWASELPNPRSRYNLPMARGWESKSVEEQQAAASTPTELKQQLTREQLDQKRQRDALLLSRKHISQQLEAAQNPHHRQMLAMALAALDEQLARLG